jgi:two-component system response regulator TctD
MKVLSIETNAAAAVSLETMLAARDHEVEFCNVATGREGIERAMGEHWDIILNNLHLGDMSGPALIQALREGGRVQTPIIVLGPESWSSTVSCLDAGADNYQVMPYHIEVLFGRMRALTRRAYKVSLPLITAGNLEYNTNSREFKVGGVSLSLTRVERLFLAELTIRKGFVVTSEQLHGLHDYQGDENLAAVFISRLRKKIASLSHGSFEIETIRGMGYKLQEMYPA